MSAIEATFSPIEDVVILAAELSRPLAGRILCAAARREGD